MRVYNILVTVAAIVFFGNDAMAATSAKDVSLQAVKSEITSARFLRAENEAATVEEEEDSTEDEERVLGLNKLSNQMSFLKLRMQANKKMYDAAHAAEKEAKAAAKLADKQARDAAKKAAKEAKEAARKAAKEAKAAADKAKKEAAAILKEDDRYNRWLLDRETPETLYKKLGLLKLGKDAEKSPNFVLFEKFVTIYSNRYPGKADEVEAFLGKVKEMLAKTE